MSFPIYDFRKDIRNVLVTPEIRARIFHMKAGEKVNLYDKALSHSHDLGYEIFLILQGKVRGLIDGEEGILEPGQMCIAAPHQTHAFEVIGNEDVIMYLSVTPHVQPTHTFYDFDGNRLSNDFMPNSAYDLSDQIEKPIDILLDEQITITNNLLTTIKNFNSNQKIIVDRLKTQIDKNDNDSISKQRNELWSDLILVFEETFKLANIWNNLAPNMTNERGNDN
jgi:quercetin dioxygenase-like cupin family protein